MDSSVDDSGVDDSGVDDSGVSNSGAYYAELHCISNFTFLRGASHPEELVERATGLGYSAIAITDECSFSGIVRAHVAARKKNLKLIVGNEFKLDDGLRFVLLAVDRKSYGKLSHLITVGRRSAEKGEYHLSRSLLEQHLPAGCLALWLPRYENNRPLVEQLKWLGRCFPHNTWIAVERSRDSGEKQKLKLLQSAGEQLGIPLCASGDVHMHCRVRRIVQDTVTAIRHRKPIGELGYALHANGERHLRTRAELQALYPKPLLDETLAIAARCNFSLEELRYEYPHELVPHGHTRQSWLRHLVEQGVQQRWPQGVSEKVKQQIEHELALVGELNYEAFFLTVHDIVRFARQQGILCQGRGSAANSVICYCLQITEVDPANMQLLFERFISKERDEPPDIDVDFEHERREEVIQYIYQKYGRDRTAIAATVITYRARSAVRDIGKALGLSGDQVDRLSRSISWWDKDIAAQLTSNGFSPDNPVIVRLIYLVQTMIGFPRHLSQHVGGFVISEGALSELVPIENAAMADRTIIQWEKDDLEALGLLKVDVLALGMLTAIRKAMQLLGDFHGRQFSLDAVPREDPGVYAMMQRADTMGVFQIESRAQMSMLPRLKPACYYDLVIQIAIVRPGPIQGDMVHPFLSRRSGKEPVTYPSEAVRSVLGRTLGVPIFQEQVMKLAIVAAGFSPGEADQLRRSMAAWKRKGGLDVFEGKLLEGMRVRGYSEDFARRIFKQIRGFGDYGFPESHSASFALLAYVSSWLKCYHPAAFTCALLNSQPMGFYAPAQLVQDAQRHGVRILPVDINCSDYDCSLQAGKSEGEEKVPLLRLGFRMVKGLSGNACEMLLSERWKKPFASAQDIVERTGINRLDLECLAAADALKSLGGDRHATFWQVSGTEQPMPLFGSAPVDESRVMLPKPSEVQDILADYSNTGVSLRRHPIALLRDQMRERGITTSKDLWGRENDSQAKVAGIVIGRQRPGTASGVVFVTLEDETGYTNVVVWPTIAEKQRRVLLQSRLMEVRGTVQKESGVLHLIAKQLKDLSPWLQGMAMRSRDFH